MELDKSYSNKLVIRPLPLNEITDEALEIAADSAKGNPMVSAAATSRAPCCGTCI